MRIAILLSPLTGLNHIAQVPILRRTRLAHTIETALIRQDTLSTRTMDTTNVFRLRTRKSPSKAPSTTIDEAPTNPFPLVKVPLVTTMLLTTGIRTTTHLNPTGTNPIPPAQKATGRRLWYSTRVPSKRRDNKPNRDS
jgi:hypothetical protein